MTETDTNIPTEPPDRDTPAQSPSPPEQPTPEPAEPAEPSRPDGAMPAATAEQDAEPISNQQPAAPDDKPAAPAGPSVVARYGLMRHIGEFRHTLKRSPVTGEKVVVRTERGVELARVISVVCGDRRDQDNDQDQDQDQDRREPPRPGVGTISPEKLDSFIKASGPEYPFRRSGRVLRLANQQDLIDFRHLQGSATEESKYCRQQIQQTNLPMRVITAEHLLGGERIVLYFKAETRVDFRSLVRNLAGRFRTRIEMRQVGARDEARLVADYERCGQRCCCQKYLKYLSPVSMRMAKVQKATLDPTKISGRCGRLMCCLRYEDESYDTLRKTLPKKDTWVRTENLLGRVVDTQILTQLVRLVLPDGTLAAVGVDELTERDLQPPTDQQLQDEAKVQADRRREQNAAQQVAFLDDETPDQAPRKKEDSFSDAARQEQDQGSPGSGGKKRRRRKKKSTQSQKQHHANKASHSKPGGKKNPPRHKKKKN